MASVNAIEICSLTALLLVSTTVLAEISPPPAVNQTNSPVESVQCGFNGDNDSYGLGVRLGAYLQWLTSIFAYNLSPIEAASMRAVNSCYQIAMMVALIVTTRTRGISMHTVEAYIILLLCLGGLCASVTWPWSSKKQAHHPFGSIGPSNLGALIRLLALVATCSYGIWFAFIGMDNMIHDACSSIVFCFARVSLHGKFRIFLKVVFVVGLIAAAVTAADSIASISLECMEWLKHWMEADGSTQASDEVSQSSLLLLLPSCIALALLVVSLETTIVWSHVETVYKCDTTGQLFPLIVGAAGVIRLAYVLLLNYLRGDLRL